MDEKCRNQCEEKCIPFYDHQKHIDDAAEAKIVQGMYK